MKVSSLSAAALMASGILLTVAPAAVIGDSINEFTTDGTQGANGWTGGYRNYTVDGGGADYDPATEFIAFDQATEWRGAGWRLVPENAPWTTLNQEGAHPNGENNAEEHWVIRRWEVPVTQPIAVTWSLRKQNTNGTGVTGSLHVEGVQVDTVPIAGNDGTGVFRTYYVNATAGERVDLALTPVGPGGDTGDGSDGSFFSMTIDDEVPDVADQPDGTLFIAADAVDSDTDNLADEWEFRYFPGDLGVLDGTGDSDVDMDGLTDLEEQSNSTNPDNSDTDADGLTDFDEIDEHATDPIIADTDGDRVSDGDEVLVYMSDPLVVDTDEDTFDDGREVDLGTDPTDPTYTPLTDQIANSIDEWSGDGTQGFLDWSYGYRNYTADGGGEDYNASSGFIAFDEATEWRGTAWRLVASNAPWTNLAQEATHPNGTNNVDEHWTIRRWTAAELTTVTPVALMWHIRKNNPNNDGVSGSVHVNGEQVDKVTIPGSDTVGSYRVVYANLLPGARIDVTNTPEGVTNRGDGSDGSSNWLWISTRIPDNPTQPDGSPFLPATGEDSDADLLPDAWEFGFFPGDLTQLSGLDDADHEMDGSPDLEELQRGTDPTDEDSDDDGLLDGVETDDGMFVDENATGTSPTAADSDGDGIDDNDEITGANSYVTNPTLRDTDADGLSDGEEPMIGTDPLDEDTDDDTYSDGEEVAGGFDPLDPASNPGTILADSMMDFSGNQGQANWTNGYRNFTLDGGETDYDAAADFIPFAGGEGLGDWDGVGQQWSGNAWDLNTAAAAPWTWLEREGTHPNGSNNGEEHWSVRRWVASDLAATTPLGLTWHTRKTNLNGGGVTGSLHINGVQVDTFAFAGGDGVGVIRTFFANLEPNDIVDLVLTPVGDAGDTADGSDGSANWLRIDTFIPSNPTQPDGTPFVPASGSDFQISSVSLDEVAKEMTITWPSANGRLYAIDRSSDMADEWLEEVDDFEADGPESTYTLPVVSNPADPLPARIFVRVRDLTGQ
ncbi:MAG: hypothetical protein ACR2RV_28780 [Verrucomicrobiales bacterium]